MLFMSSWWWTGSGGGRCPLTIKRAQLGKPLQLQVDQIRPLLPQMSIRRTLEENVFGPFNANDVLDEYVTHKKNMEVDLHWLEVTRNGKASG